MHCAVCREIEQGCQEEIAAGAVPNCAMCSRKGLIDAGNGTGVACNACARGYRMQLWLKHQDQEQA